MVYCTGDGEIVNIENFVAGRGGPDGETVPPGALWSQLRHTRTGKPIQTWDPHKAMP